MCVKDMPAKTVWIKNEHRDARGHSIVGWSICWGTALYRSPLYSGIGNLRFTVHFQQDVMNTCPFCKKELIKSGDLSEDGSEKCPDNHYFYSHSYGCHELILDLSGDRSSVLTFGWHYSEPEYEGKAREAVIKAFIDYAGELKK